MKIEKEERALICFHDVEKRLIQLHGQNVLLDYAVAELYGVKTKELKQAVHNNPEKFPQGYYMEISRDELQSLRSNFLTLKNERNRFRGRPACSASLLQRLGIVVDGTGVNL
jgi:hypothetical protein